MITITLTFCMNANECHFVTLHLQSSYHLNLTYIYKLVALNLNHYHDCTVIFLCGDYLLATDILYACNFT